MCSALALASSACSSSSDKSAPGGGGSGSGGQTGTSTDALQLISWWTGPGEAEALQALMDTYKTDNPGSKVNLDSSVTADNWRMILPAGIDHSPWDAFQLAGADMPQFRIDHPGDVLAVDDIWNEASLKKAAIPEILKSVQGDDGSAYGVVTGVHRNNSFMFNKQIFDKYKLTAPTSVDEFLSDCATLKKAGVTPVATTFQTWALRILFDELLAGTLGASAFDDLVQGRTPPTDATMKAGIKSAIATFGTVLSDYVDPATNDQAKYGWTDACDDVFNGKAAMLMHGDWDKGYMIHSGWTPGVDFGMSGPPGADDLFVYGADVFGLPATAPHPDLATKFLQVVASKDGQVAFNKYKGATPMRSDVRAQLDDTGKASLDALVNAKVLSGSHANADWDTAIGQFAMDGDQDAMLAAYMAATP
ncbi:MAG TPA: ABC transporter substrate-binding protein [Polyangiaceae bacterium]